MKKRVIWCIVGFVFGALAILGGVSKMNSTSVECGGKTMFPGDTCEETSKTGTKTEHTYEEQRRTNQGENWVIIVVGGVIILVSAFQLVKGLRNRTKVAAAPPDPTAHWTPQQPAPQWNQQQGAGPAPQQGWHSQPPPPQQQAPQQQPAPQQQWTPQQPPPPQGRQ